MDELINLEISVASKSAEAYINSPSSVYVFTAMEIERMGARSVEELLNYVPGYFTGLDIEQGKAYRTGARGRSTALSESVLFLVNGSQLNDLYTGGVSIINRLVPVENIKQIEVIRGPGSSLYGSNAFLGVVNIVTKKNINDIQLSYGNFQSVSVAGNFSKSYENVDINAFVKGFSNDGYEFDDFTDLVGRTSDMTDQERGFDAMLGVSYKGLKLEMRHHEREFKGYYGLGGVADFNNSEESFQTMVNLIYTLQFTEKLKFNFKVGRRVETWKTKAVIFPAGYDGWTEDFFAGPFMKSSAINLNADATQLLSEKNELLAGFSYERAGISKAVSLTTHDYRELNYFGGIREYELPFNNIDDMRYVLGFFIQDKHTFNKYLKVTYGARIDNYSDFGTSFNPRGAVIGNTPWKGIVKVMYGQAFRAPNYLELYDQNNPVDYGNTALDPEKIKTIEIAYTQSFDVFSASATYFNNTIENLIFLDPEAPPVQVENNPLLAPTFYNLPKDIHTSGIELGMIYRPFHKFTFTGTFTKLMDDFAYMPKQMISARANIRFGRFNFNFNGIYHGEIKEVSNQSGYLVLNSRLQFKYEDLTLFGSVNNLTDKIYRTPTTLSDVGVVNRGRLLSFGLKINF
ncbi:TonB-dependent receptor [Fulvivirga sp. 29W222]|uniref:TonB-dependent receptor n=1 Tax=Fulvivirga marina TaxID=2494733 RepID=A0A937FWL9_9BACT|nr:TonB-dependent receptor [Fulvivirga marina]